MQAQNSFMQYNPKYRARKIGTGIMTMVKGYHVNTQVRFYSTMFLCNIDPSAKMFKAL